MASILDHVSDKLPRNTIYGGLRGSNVCIGKYFRELYPSSNQTEYKYPSSKKISFVIASPDKLAWHDMKSMYLKFKLTNVLHAQGKISEPAGSAIINRIVVRMNGTVIEDISRYNHLNAFLKRKLLTRVQKNAKPEQGWDYVNTMNTSDLDDGTVVEDGTSVGAQNWIGADGADPTDNVDVRPSKSWMIEPRGMEGQTLCCSLDLAGILDCQTLLSGYYMPLEIDLFLEDPKVCGQLSSSITDNARPVTSYGVTNPRLCIDQIILSPEYVSAFEAQMIAASGGPGIQIPFQSYYTFDTLESPGDTTFWVRKPVRYLRSVMWGAVEQQARAISVEAKEATEEDPEVIGVPGNGGTEEGFEDSFRFGRVNLVRAGLGALAAVGTYGINSWQVSVGSKNYREIAGTDATVQNNNFEESDCMFYKCVKSYNDSTVGNDEFKPSLRKCHMAQTGLDLDFSPDLSVLASESTLNGNDVRLRLKGTAGANKFKIYVFMKYQCSLALYPGNEVRLLET